MIYRKKGNNCTEVLISSLLYPSPRHCSILQSPTRIVSFYVEVVPYFVREVLGQVGTEQVSIERGGRVDLGSVSKDASTTSMYELILFADGPLQRPLLRCILAYI